MEYDRQGHLAWSTDRIRAWVEAKTVAPPASPSDGLATLTRSLQQPIASDVPGEAPLERYEVVYRGGHPAYPKERAGGIRFSVFPDRFEFQPTSGSMWFVPMTIPHSMVLDLEIVERQLSSFQGIFGGLDSRQLNQKNNIHISYQENENVVVLRLEMVSGFTVMGAAKKCRQLEDRLRNHKIREKFRQTETQSAAAQQQADDIPTQIEKLADLRDKGIISPAEFETKKSDLLARM